MNTEVAKMETKELATADVWGAGEGLAAEDLLIPKILLMQKMSDLVDQAKAKPGEFRSSITGELLGDEKKPVEVIVFDSFKNWLIFENNEFKEVLPWTGERLLWEEGTIKRQLSYNFYCLLTSKIDDIPHLISLKGTSTKAAKTLMTAFARLGRIKKPSAAKTFKLGCHQEKNDKGSYYVIDVLEGRDTTPQEIALAKSWCADIRQSRVAVVHDVAREEVVDTLKGDAMPF